MDIINQFAADVKCVCGSTPKVTRDPKTCEYVVKCCHTESRSLSLPKAVKVFRGLNR